MLSNTSGRTPIASKKQDVVFVIPSEPSDSEEKAGIQIIFWIPDQVGDDIFFGGYYNNIMKQEAKKELPQSFQSYFWDVEFEKLEIKRSAHLIIKRVLDRGNLSDIRWLLKTYGKDEIKKVVMGTKDLARPTGNFWADILCVDKTQVPCLQKPYFPIHFGLSS
ncbi:hypothetical protein HY358_02515 [Candidatus Roizmanbacteria bacterium]|nr:hypothetical protein [Candidatus Roizmanbacteria bacterium]